MFRLWSAVTQTSFQFCPGCSSSSSPLSTSSFSFNFLPAPLPPPHCRLLRGRTAACWASLGRVTPCCWSRGRCPEMFHRPLHGSSQQIYNHSAAQLNPKFINKTDTSDILWKKQKSTHQLLQRPPLNLSSLHSFSPSEVCKGTIFKKGKYILNILGSAVLW